tara:strand:+ start:568 stop:1131 length:564 start_codon:yes stop_codon:yes gene_type:complete
MKTKVCTKCGEEKRLSSENFTRWIGSKDGFYPSCKTCKRQDNREYDKKNREKRRLYQVEYRKNNKEKVMDYQRQYNDKLPTGIYIIENKINNSIYVGASTRMKIRWREHKINLSNQQHGNPILQEDYNTYGLEAFQFKVLKEYPSNTQFEFLEEIEQETIKSFLAEGKKLYNIALRAGYGKFKEKNA